MSDKITMDYGDRDWLQSVADNDTTDNILSIGRAVRVVNSIEQLEGRIALALKLNKYFVGYVAAALHGMKLEDMPESVQLEIQEQGDEQSKM